MNPLFTKAELLRLKDLVLEQTRVLQRLAFTDTRDELAKLLWIYRKITKALK